MLDHDLAERVLDSAEHPYHCGSCPAATHAGEIQNAACGDWVRVELRLTSEKRIEEAWFQSKGCLISRAAASLLMADVEGKCIGEIAAMQPAAVLDYFGAALTIRRRLCCLLGYFALRQALGLTARGEEAADNPFRPN